MSACNLEYEWRSKRRPSAGSASPSKRRPSTARCTPGSPTRCSAAERGASSSEGRTATIGLGDLLQVSAGRGVRVNQGAAPVLHTNHALDPDITDDEDEDALMKSYPSSRHRLEVLQRVAAGASSVGDLVVALGNQEGFPDSICKGRSQAEPTQTAFSIIADCGSRALHICPGSQAEHRYYPILLPA